MLTNFGMYLPLTCIGIAILSVVDGKPKYSKYGHSGSKSSLSCKESKDDACSVNPCLNGGNCNLGPNREAKCSCAVGFSGRFCQDDACSVNPCLNGGNCTLGLNKKPKCSCAYGFSGIFCGVDVCSVNPCLNGGNCTLSPNREAKCSCAVGFSGTICGDDACTVNPCLNGGSCTLGVNREAVCSCVVGFTGTFCGDDACTVNPCLNGGNCTLGVNREAVCSCVAGFTGTFCGQDACTINPCLNGGSCTLGIKKEAVCTCTSGFIGTFCGDIRLNCPVEFEQLGNGCYAISNRDLMIYEFVKFVCPLLNPSAIPFEPNTRVELDTVLKKLEDIFLTTNIVRSYWIGLNDQFLEGNVVYESSGAPFTLVDLSDTNKNTNDCVALVKNATGTNFLPVMRSCGDNYNAICESII